MKRLCLFILLLASTCFAATFPDYANIKNKPAQDVREFYRPGDSTTDHTAMFQRAFNAGVPLVLGSGTWNISNLTIEPGTYSVNGFSLVGAGPYSTILNCTADSGHAITINDGSNITLKGFALWGNKTASGGIALGKVQDAYRPVGRIRLDDLKIKNFNKVGAAGISLIMGLETGCNNCVLSANYYGVHRPHITGATTATSSFTTFRFGGDSSYIGQCGTLDEELWSKAAINAAGSGGIGFVADSPIGQARFYNTVFENNAREAVFVASAPGSVIRLLDCYFEENDHANLATACIFIAGNSAATNNLAQAVIEGCDFVTKSAYSTIATSCPTIRASNAHVILDKNVGLYSIGRIAGDSTARFKIGFNNLGNDAETVLTQYPDGNIAGSYGGQDWCNSTGYPIQFGETQFYNGLVLGTSLKWQNTYTAANLAKVSSGLVGFGDCSGGVSKSLFRVKHSATFSGVATDTTVGNPASLMSFINIGQALSGNTYGRGAAGYLISSTSTLGESGGGVVVPDVKSSFSTPSANGVASFSVAVYTTNIGTDTFDLGLTITTNGPLNNTGPVYVNWHAILCGQITPLNL